MKQIFSTLFFLTVTVVAFSRTHNNTIRGFSIADNRTGASAMGFRFFSAMPVNFTNFYINRSGNNIQLTWSTANEINNSHFEIERSFDGHEWKNIALVFGDETNNSINNYSYPDKNIVVPVVYYRVRQVDVNRRSQYSAVKMIRLTEAITKTKILSTQKIVTVDFITAVENDIEVSVMNNNGQIIRNQKFANSSYKINFNLTHVAGGAYIVHVTDNKGWSEVTKVIL